MSFAIDPAHREAILKFVTEKSMEDGIVEHGEMLELMFTYWDLITDAALVTAEADLIELGRLKAGVATRQTELDSINADIATREAAGGTRGTAPVTPAPPRAEPPFVPIEETLANGG